MAKDRDGNAAAVGTRVCILQLAGRWLDDLPDDERARVLSMVGEAFLVHEIDSFGQPWVMKEWRHTDDKVFIHDIALDPWS